MSSSPPNASSGTRNVPTITASLKRYVGPAGRNGSVTPKPTPTYITQKPSRRIDSDRLEVPQIVPGCSVNERNSSPYGPWSSTGTAHQADATAASNPARHAKLHTSRQLRPSTAASYKSRPAGATSAHAITPAFTPPPASERISANAIGQRQPRGLCRPR